VEKVLAIAVVVLLAACAHNVETVHEFPLHGTTKVVLCPPSSHLLYGGHARGRITRTPKGMGNVSYVIYVAGEWQDGKLVPKRFDTLGHELWHQVNWQHEDETLNPDDK